MEEFCKKKCIYYTQNIEPLFINNCRHRGLNELRTTHIWDTFFIIVGIFKNILNTLEILYYHLTLFKVNRRFLKHLGHFNKSHPAWWKTIHVSHKQGMYTITLTSATVLSSVSFSKKFGCSLQWPWIFWSVDRPQGWE